MEKRQTKFITIVMPPMQNLESKRAPKLNVQLHAPNRKCVLPVNPKQK
jgi:hypothetical protein